MVRDEQGRPVGRIRQTMDVAAGTGSTLEGKQVLYQSGVTLPPGRFAVKVVVRENTNGAIGSFEASVIVPELKQAPVKVSSVVLSTQLQPLASAGGPTIRSCATACRSSRTSPTSSGATRSCSSISRSTSRRRRRRRPDLRASLAFYRGKIKVLETPIVERTALDAPDRKAAIFRLEVPADAFKPGLYTCQINIIDAAAGKFAFPRLALLVR